MATWAFLVPLRSAMARNDPMRWSPPWWRATASMAAQRTSLEPCLVMRPRATLVSDSRCWGVSPAHEHSASAERNRVTSPISATNTAANTRPTPWMAWMAW